DDRRLEALDQALKFFAPNVRRIVLPAWDTVPYDRVGPAPDLIAKRMTALTKLTFGGRKHPTLVLTTVNAILQKLPPRSFIKQAVRQLAPGQRMDMNRLMQRLSLGGYTRTGTVIEAGEYAVRGGILDVFPPGRVNPVRLDFFGDTLETIKAFDAESQRTSKALQKLVLMPMSEVAFGEDAIATFRQSYVSLFGGNTNDDPMYQAVVNGQSYPGVEHWLPFFFEDVETLFDYVGDDAAVSFDADADSAVRQRFEQIEEHYLARTDGLEAEAFGAPPYKPVPPDRMFVTGPEWASALSERGVFRLTEAKSVPSGDAEDAGGRLGRLFTEERQADGGDLFGAVIGHIKAGLGSNRRVMLAAW
ncbi:MAG: transcription-repair coupling factor, partial [Pseudomonadota bacterium]